MKFLRKNKGRTAIKLSDHFTYAKLIRFTLPSVIMIIFTSIYGVVDGFFVSNFVGKTSFAAVNFIMPVMMILGAVGFMFGTGGSVLVAVLRLGIVGAALATATCQLVGGVVPIIYFIRKNTSLLRLTKTHYDGRAMLKTCTNGSSELLTNISMSLVGMLYNIQLLKYAGENGVAAYGVLMYVNYIFVSAFIGYESGVAPVVGFNFGSDNRRELHSLLKKSTVIISCLSAAMFIISELMASPLSMLFVGYDAELFSLTLGAFRKFSLSFLFAGFAIGGSALFTALNDGLVSALLSFLRTMVFQIAAVILLPPVLGIDGIWYSVPVAELLAAVVTVVFVIGKQKKYGY